MAAGRPAGESSCTVTGRRPLQHGGGFAGAEQLLQLHCQHRRPAAVIQPGLTPRGDRQGLGKPLLQLVAALPGQAAPEGFAQIEALQIATAAQPLQLIPQPGLRCGDQSRVAAIGPGGAQVCAGQAEPLLQLTAGVAPGQGLQAHGRQPLQQGRQHRLSRSLRPGPPLQHQSPQGEGLFSADPLLLRVPHHQARALARLRRQGFQAGARQGQCQLDAAIAAGPLGAGDGQGFAAQQPIAGGSRAPRPARVR